MITAKTPWEAQMGDVPMHLEYFEGSMFEALENIAKKYPENVAFDFMGKSTTYPQAVEKIRACADCGIPAIVIARPPEEGLSFEEVLIACRERIGH